jgi:transposase
MDDIQLFQMALGLTPPWQVRDCRFDPAQSRLDIALDFPKGSLFACPECGAPAKAYDTEDKQWRHLNFFQHTCYLHARLPRVKCDKCGVRQVSVPWARPGSGFTLLFEAFVLALARKMPVLAVAQIVGEHDTRLWRLIDHWVNDARDRREDGAVKEVGIDETSSKRGHNYISVFVDLEKRRVLFATPGKDAATVEAFAKDLAAHGGDPEKILEVCSDLSPAFIAGVRDHLANAKQTFDKFHLVKLINEAVDEVRRAEQEELPEELVRTRYLWLKNPENLTHKQFARLMGFLESRHTLKTARAWRLKLSFQHLFNQSPGEAEQFLKDWYFWATHSRLEPMIKVARTIKAHWDGVLRWFKSKVTNGLLEGINSLIQAAKAKARGYRSTRNLITIVYLIAGRLDIRVTHTI